MQRMAERNVTINIWTARVIPLILAGIVGYATYVLVALLCVNYLLVKHDDQRAAIPIIVIYFILFTLMTVSFLRLFYTTTFDPPYVPLGPTAIRDGKERGKLREEEDGIGTGEYNSGNAKDDPDSPGLELFYTKDVFWKPDRTHHDSASGRCIRKMDHFCPWVGGPVGENNFKFFIQFTWWTALYCLHLLIVMAIYIHQQIVSPVESLNSHFAAILALAAFFFLFTSSMTGGSIDLALRNLTTVERLGAKTKLYTLAIKKPPLEELVRISPYMVQNATYREITYPLGANSIAHESRPSAIQTEKPEPAQQLSTQGQIPTLTSSGAGLESNFPGTELSPGPMQQVDQLGIDTSSEQTPTVATEEPSSREVPGSTDIPVEQMSGTGAGATDFSARDMQATRTFAVLRMLDQGDNPWDLGSALLNWKTVMGNRVIDWFLPSRSPCSNHEQSSSQFSIGPKVEKLKAAYYFTQPKDLREKGHPKSRKSRFSNREGKIAGETTQGSTRINFWKPTRQGHESNKNSSSSRSEDQIKLENLNGNTVQPQLSVTNRSSRNNQ
ncbi:hypothetical protein G7Y89_g5043 [Cudoniella acicularis]|uniref:Palmitoyltransferase n=1 Tax=Cudoniella acicularis TaxID=354080 RepID=A0A8H4RQF9_9HELO|nr:hypothetical protein G7Y89_g5043 [Cudoniella acicularis]